MNCSDTGRTRLSWLALLCVILAPQPLAADSTRGAYNGVHPVARFDVSPPLKDIPPLRVPSSGKNKGGLIIDPAGTTGEPVYGPQEKDTVVQGSKGPVVIPSAFVSFNGPPNLSGVSPPDPVGDIGPDHYVVMSNMFFEVYDRSGVSLFGPAANNTLWSGFGGPCEQQNAGDPIVLYDQLADRWLLTQFTSSGAELFNCVALSTTPDPTGSYYRWAISNGPNLPDYPKFGIGEEAYFISTRDFLSLIFVGVGVYALDRAEMLAGNPNPTVISFFVDNSIPYHVGDGILPMDIEGLTLPPPGSPHYFMGSMDNGGPYGAPQDALTLWKFVVDFDTPENSSFTLTNTIPMAPMDSIFPCVGIRSCIAQPSTANKIDHQGYRQRPLHRLVYRNFGTHESLVTNQSVEAVAGISGIRWWEVRSPNSTPAIFQEGTYAPGVEDGIHRWMGSAAMDSAGNIGLGYSASSSTTHPSVWYTGRLVTDPPGTMPQGEGTIIDGTGSLLSSQRWGDYSSMSVDPTDDCSFWYVNEYVPVSSPFGWQLRIGAFRFEECGTPAFSLTAASSPQVKICAGEDVEYAMTVRAIAGFNETVSLALTGEPGGTSTSFSVNPVTSFPDTSTLTIGNTGGVPTGSYELMVEGMMGGFDTRTSDLILDIFNQLPPQPSLLVPADKGVDVSLKPIFEWSGPNSDEYVIEVATDAGFSNIVFTANAELSSVSLDTQLANNTKYFWRVRASNPCGGGADSEVFSFTTVSLPGECTTPESTNVVHSFDFESGDQGWTHNAAVGADTWGRTSDNPFAGSFAWHGNDPSVTGDQRLVSPVLAIPSDLNMLTLRFFDFQDMQNNSGTGGCWDAGILELSTDGGVNFTQVPNSDLLTNPYTGLVTAGGSPNPLADLQGWCGAPKPYSETRVDIADLAGEANVVFRFRIGTDGSVGAPGWEIDDVSVVGCTDPSFLFENSFEQ